MDQKPTFPHILAFLCFIIGMYLVVRFLPILIEMSNVADCPTCTGMFGIIGIFTLPLVIFGSILIVAAVLIEFVINKKKD